MEQRGIQIQGAGTESVNKSLSVVDPSTSGNTRVWCDIDNTVKIQNISGRGWVISSYDGTIVYYSENNPSTTVVDPWNVLFVVGTTDQGTAPAPTLTTYDDPNIQITIGESTTTTDPTTGDQITTQTVTYYNAITNYRFSHTNETRTKTSYTTVTTERYDTVTLTLGKIYRFSFVKDFADLGYSRDPESENHSVYCGVYRVDKIMSYKDVLSAGIDVYNNLYAPISVSKDVYNKDEPTFQNTMFYKLVDPRDEGKVIYMPLSFVDGTPDGSIARYDKLIMGINLGVFSDLQMITDMITLFTEMLEVKYGIKADGIQFPEDKELVQLQRYDDVYLTTEEYNLLDEARQSVIENASSTEFLDRVFESEMNTLRTENASLKARLEAYEQAITNIKG